uniref:Uncharacterized protein n=1 Tax=Moniliophthora roreri TaxID=221103 RepID=A0A0W0FWN6_MONRR
MSTISSPASQLQRFYWSTLSLCRLSDVDTFTSPSGYDITNDTRNQGMEFIDQVKANRLDSFSCYAGPMDHYFAESNACRGINGGSLTAWIYYMVAIIYDLGTTAISVTYLLKHQFSSPSTMLARLTKMMLYDGIGYFVFLTIINCANLIIYHADPDIQTAWLVIHFVHRATLTDTGAISASLGYTATYIFSQRLLLSLYEVSSERRAQTIDGTYTISQTISSARAVNQAMRSQFEPKGSFADSLQLTNPDFQLDTLEAAHADDVNVQVRVERTVTVERRHRKTYELENYSHSGTSSMAHKNIGHTISIVSVASRR